MPLIEVAEGFEDHFERIRASLPCSSRDERDAAVMAVPALENFVLLVALACAGDIGARAVDATIKVSADERSAVWVTMGSASGWQRF